MTPGVSVSKWRALRGAAPLCAALLVLVSGCTDRQDPPTPETSTRAAPTSAPLPPSLSRQVPAGERVLLGDLSPGRLCALVPGDVLDELAFPVGKGTPREVGFDPPVRGCVFRASDGERSVLVAAQPEGLAKIGMRETELAGVPASRTLHAGDCTVYAGVSRATLQVSVVAPEPGTEECEAAAAVATYAVQGLKH